jgi:Ca-activated chloride channel homolog
VRVSVLGVGTRDGAPISLPQGGLLEDAEGKVAIARLDEAALRDVAQRGGGAYATLRVDDADLDAVLLPADPVANVPSATGLAADLWREEGPWLLIPLCMLAALAFRRGWVGLILLAALPVSAHALEWEALWQRDDQRGARALAEGDPARAATLFDDPEWKGSALYRAGDYAASAQALAGADGARAHYNRGNAFARAGDFANAIAAYEHALELDPTDEDARYNLDLLKRAQQAGSQAQSPSGADDTPQGDAGGQDGEAAGENGMAGDTEGGNAGARGEAGERGNDAQGAAADPAGGADDGQSAAIPPSEGQEGFADDAPADPDAGEGRAEEDGAPGAEGGLASSDTLEEEEAARATEQWLRRIPDDPGGLLRRKFMYQYRQQQAARGYDAPGVQRDEPEPW